MALFSYHILALWLGVVLDSIVGDPHFLPHPIRLIGRWISFLDKKMLGEKPDEVSAKKQKGRGFLLVLLVIIPVAVITFFITYGLYRVNIYAGTVAETIISFYCLSLKSLFIESGNVVIALREEGLDGARKSLSMIVGRDTKDLSVKEVIKATVETIAENTSDGVVAPLFYLLLGGPVLGMVYKAINTMDSMVGYKNDRYKNFGFFAAKLDDIANFIPSRFAAFLVIFTSVMMKNEFSGKEARRIYKRDRFNHKSPNSAQTESAFAGAMGIMLGGGASYFGKWVDKPTIGDETREIEIEDVDRAHRIMIVSYSTFLCLILLLDAALWYSIRGSL